MLTAEMVRIEMEPAAAEKKALLLRRASVLLDILRAAALPGGLPERNIVHIQAELKTLANLFEVAAEAPDLERGSYLIDSRLLAEE